MVVRRLGFGSAGSGGNLPGRPGETPPRGDYPGPRRRRVRSRRGPPSNRPGASGHHRGRARRRLPVQATAGAGGVTARWRWVWWAVALLGSGLALRTLFDFPWKATFLALRYASLWLLIVAGLLNFLAPLL